MLDIPTGLGKTAVMAVWLAARTGRAKLPRRLLYVVDRRAVVDQATEVAIALRNLVDRNPELKTSLGLKSGRSLPVSTLRGQYADNREWLEDPAAPAIIVVTVDMAGSRLLFEGYRVSRKMRPFHAGLLGVDSLVVLDEAHLVPPFEKLLESIVRGADFGPRDEAHRILIPTFHVISLSATGRTVEGATFELTNKDLDHPVVKKRLDAKKRLRIENLNKSGDANEEKKKLEDALAREAWDLTGKGIQAERVIVFADSRDVAGKTKSAVEKIAKADGINLTDRTELFVGGRRVFERAQAKERIEKLGFLAGTKASLDKPAFLFATSAAEVGVDLDADHMVCDVVPWERIVQRLGRVNRRGDGDATVVVVAGGEPKNIDALLGKPRHELSRKEAMVVERTERIRAVRKALDRLPTSDGARDASPGALRVLKQKAEADSDLRRVLDDATTPEPLRPALTRALIDAWSMTSLDTHTGRPAIDPWLRGWIEEDRPQTEVVWRMYLPVRSHPQPTRKEIEGFFEAASPHLSEILEMETFPVVEWLQARANSLLDGPATGQEENSEAPGKEDVVAFVLAGDGGLRRTLRLRELTDSDTTAKEREQELRQILGNATVVLDARIGGLKDGLLDKERDEQPRTADDGRQWIDPGTIGFRVRAAATGGTTIADRDWRERSRFVSEVSEDGEPLRWLIIDKWQNDAATEEDRSAARRYQLLEQHQSWAEERARTLARGLYLPSPYAEMLATAARLHDEGKRARRWQLAFNAPSDGPYAKTKGPINYSVLDGYRHEVGSLPYAVDDDRIKGLPEELRDLALHLIAAHHGFGRPVIGTSGCEDAPPSALEERARQIALRFARLQKRWGAWGLAWWESLLRAADQQASRDNDEAAEDVMPGEAV